MALALAALVAVAAALLAVWIDRGHRAWRDHGDRQAQRLQRRLPPFPLPPPLAASPPPPSPPLPPIVLLVTAHPDDECMFFGPSLLALRRAGALVHLLCLSTGNSAGLGAVRTRELHAAAAVLGLTGNADADGAVHIIDRPDVLPDRMDAAWPTAVVAATVRATMAAIAARHARPVAHLLTFDAHGVSGHANHRACHAGVAAVLTDTDPRAAVPVTGWMLDSVPLWRKYTAFAEARVAAPAAPLPDGTGETAVVWTADPRAYRQIVAAMQCHASQYVWFRRLFVTFSAYLYVNRLRPMRGRPA